MPRSSDLGFSGSKRRTETGVVWCNQDTDSCEHWFGKRWYGVPVKAIIEHVTDRLSDCLCLLSFCAIEIRFPIPNRKRLDVLRICLVFCPFCEPFLELET